MFKSYLKIAFRSLKRTPLVTFINIFGLGLSMSVVMMEMLIVQSELGYDRFHPYPERTYRVISQYTPKNGNQWKMASTPLALRAALVADTGVIADVVNIYPAFNGTARFGAKELTVNGAFTEPSFFKIFGFSLAEGNPVTALQMPNTMVISRVTAGKFFGNTDALGKSIYVQGAGLFLVTGVLNETPGKSHIDFDAYASASSIPTLEQNHLLPVKSNDWGDFRPAYTYVLLKPGFGEKPLAGLLNAIIAGHNLFDKNGRCSFGMQPIEKISPADAGIYNYIGKGTTWTKLWVGIDVSLIILLAACFNYTNLTIARALTRAKEAGIRKIVGAKRYQLFLQYIMESTMLAFLSLAFAWLLLSFIIHYAPFNDGYEFIPSSWRYNTPYILSTIGFALLVGLLAGAAPASILSAFKPLRVLKSLSTARIFGRIGLQKSLIVFQYSLSLVIIIFLCTFYRQFAFMGSANPGFVRDNMMVVPLGAVDAKIASQMVAMVSGVKSVSLLSTTFKPHFEGMRGHAWVDNQQKDAVSINYFFTDPSFIPSMHLGIIAGRNFDALPDSSSEREIILNMRAVRSLGFKSYADAPGSRIWVNDSTQLTIIGVVNDFKYENAGKPVDPMAFRNKRDVFAYLFIGVDSVDNMGGPDKARWRDKKGGSDKGAIDSRVDITRRVGLVWKTLAPSVTFTSSWLDEDLDQNNAQKATISLLGYLAFIALSIATLGLLGLVIFTVETRRKEISIRKVIGAGKGEVIKILSKSYILLLVISGAIAVPLGYTLSFLFLQNFAERVGYVFVGAMVSFLSLLSIGMVTIISQTWKAAMDNPVNSLRTE